MDQVPDTIKELGELAVDFFLLADRAEAVGGKLYVMGGAWDRYSVQNFEQPVLISFAIGVLVPWTQTNVEHAVRVSIEDADRQPLGFEMKAGFVCGRPPTVNQTDPQRAILAIPMVPVKFPRPGSYQAVLEINGTEQRRVQFYAVDPQRPFRRKPPALGAAS